MSARLWDAQTRAILASIPTSELDWCEDMVFSADGQVVVTCGQDMKVQTWSMEDERNLELTLADSSNITSASGGSGRSFPRRPTSGRGSVGRNHLSVAAARGPACGLSDRGRRAHLAGAFPRPAARVTEGHELSGWLAAGDPGLRRRPPGQRSDRSSHRAASWSMRRSRLTEPRWPSRL